MDALYSRELTPMKRNPVTQFSFGQATNQKASNRYRNVSPFKMNKTIMKRTQEQMIQTDPIEILDQCLDDLTFIL